MYCKNCGHKNPADTNYCLQDGFPLKESTGDIIFTKEQSTYCKQCGQENDNALYCHNCGAFLLKGETITQKIIPSISTSRQMKIPNVKTGSTEFISSYLKPSIIGAFTSLGILIAISLVIQFTASDNINNFFAELFEIGDYINLDIKLFGITDIMLLSHLVGFKINISDYLLELHLGIIFLLLIPFISLFIGGIISTIKNPEMSVKARIYSSVITGIIYAILLAIISLFAGISISKDLILVGINIENNYNFIDSLLNGFILGTLFSLLGYLFQSGSFKTTSFLSGAVKNGTSIHQGIATIFRGIGISIILLVIALLISGDIEEILEGGAFFALFIIPQLGVYLWDFLNLISMNINAFIFDLGHISIFSLFNGEIAEYIDDEIKAFAILALIIPILLFLWAGRKIKHHTSGNVINEMIAFSLTYSILMTFLAFVTSFNFSYYALAEFSLLKTFFSTFIFSFVIGFIGYRFTKNSSATYSDDTQIKV